MTTEQREFIEIAPALIQPNPWQPRSKTKAEDVKSLAASIKIDGLLQAPLVRRVQAATPGKTIYEIAFGHMRIAAWQQNTADPVPVLVQELTDEQMAIFALTENLHRKDITPLDAARAYKRALEIDGLTQETLADRVSMARSTIANSIRVLDLPKTVLAYVDDGRMAVHAAREFLVFHIKGHSHAKEIDFAISRCVTAREFTTPVVRRAIREAVLENEKDWRPLAGPKGDQGDECAQYARLTLREPTFDVEAFKAEHPGLVHAIPRATGKEDSREWTCGAREWSRAQTAATRIANQEAEEKAKAQGKKAQKSGSETTAVPWGTTRALSPKAKLRVVLEEDPVYKAAMAAQNTPISEAEAEQMAIAALVLDTDPIAVASGKKEDKTTDRANGLRIFRNHMVSELKRTGTIQTMLLQGKLIDEVIKHLQLGDYGVTEAQATKIMDKLHEELVTASIKLTEVKTSDTLKDVSALGPRTTLVDVDEEVVFVIGDERHYKGQPAAFDDPDECTTTCIKGAAWQDNYSGSFRLVCTNRACFSTKREKGRDTAAAEMAVEYGKDAALDIASQTALYQKMGPEFSRVIVAILAKQYTKMSNLRHKYQEDFGAYVPEILKRAAKASGVDLEAVEKGHLGLDLERVTKAMESLGETAQRSVASSLLTYAARFCGVGQFVRDTLEVSDARIQDVADELKHTLPNDLADTIREGAVEIK